MNNGAQSMDPKYAKTKTDEIKKNIQMKNEKK